MPGAGLAVACLPTPASAGAGLLDTGLAAVCLPPPTSAGTALPAGLTGPAGPAGLAAVCCLPGPASAGGSRLLGARSTGARAAVG